MISKKNDMTIQYKKLNRIRYECEIIYTNK